jgi:hypothetical protein
MSQLRWKPIPSVSAVMLGALTGFLIGFFHSIQGPREGISYWVGHYFSDAVTRTFLGGLITLCGIGASRLLTSSEASPRNFIPRGAPSETERHAKDHDTRSERASDESGASPRNDDEEQEDDPILVCLRTEIARVAGLRDKLARLHGHDLGEIRRRLSSMDYAIYRGGRAIQDEDWDAKGAAIKDLQRFEAPIL